MNEELQALGFSALPAGSATRELAAAIVIFFVTFRCWLCITQVQSSRSKDYLPLFVRVFPKIRIESRWIAVSSPSVFGANYAFSEKII